jgi:hypothetical protein
VLHGFKPTSGLDARYPTLATIDAKGDLLGGTAADTIGRLAVGSNGTVLTADSAETTGMKWATASATDASRVPGQTPRSGAYIALGGTGTASPGMGTLRAYRLDLAASGTADRIGIEITTSAASSTVALAIHNHDASTGLPGTVLLDAGTVDSTSTGFKEITISQALSAGSYWLSSLSLGGSPTFRIVVAGSTQVPGFAQADMALNNLGVSRSSLSSIPSPLGATGTSLNVPRVYLRFA